MSLRLGIVATSSVAALIVLGSCTTTAQGQRADRADAGPAPAPVATRTAAPITVVMNPSAPEPDDSIVYSGELEQGGWIRGKLPGNTRTARLGDQRLDFAEDGSFFAAFDRDQGPSIELSAMLIDGRTKTHRLTIAPRDWDLEYVNVPYRAGRSSAEFQRLRGGELEQIAAARARQTDAQGWRQDFIWPATGRISGRFGAQRVYQGKPGPYHSGLDIAQPTGTPYQAPADGVVTLVAQDPFTLEGRLLMIDHGMGLNSAFLHSATIVVREGQKVRQGQYLGTIGATGRATGPHLHWSLKWHDSRLDPLLFLGPMPD